MLNALPSPAPSNASKSASSGAIVIPCDSKQFGGFIADLISKPQQLKGKISGNFSVTYDNIKQLHNLLIQRIETQNENSFIQLISQIYFSDNSAIRLDSLKEFENYHETKPVESLVAHFTWIFLVHFKGHGHPEKQEIQVSIVGERNEDFDMYDEDDQIYLEDGTIGYRISHSERTWGVDIENLVRTYISGLVVRRTGISGYCQKNAYLIHHALYTATIILSSLSALVGLFYYGRVQKEHFFKLKFKCSDI